MFWILLSLSCTGPKERVDNDGDGVIASLDCDDNDSNISPDNEEICDGIDNDCDGEIDNTPIDGSVFYADGDNDGFGSLSFFNTSCEQPAGFVSNDQDCNDEVSTINPNTVELCDGIDNDCNMLIDDIAESGLFIDADEDGAGDPNLILEECDDSVTAVDNDLDCDDTDPNISGLSPEVCDDLDNDCDGDIDEGVKITFFEDMDNDGYGSESVLIEACLQPEGYTENGGDCDDALSMVNPDADEECDFIDNDCDDEIDEADAIDSSVWYVDSDGDGFGDDENTLLSCIQPSGTVALGGDCNDMESTINPDVLESCDSIGIDENCNGLINDDDLYLDPSSLTTFYPDNDIDGEGDGENPIQQCDSPLGYVLNASDCDDTDSTVNTNGIELCDGIDNNCDGTVDEGFPSSEYFIDADGDNFGDPSQSIDACQKPIGYSINDEDCNDNDSNINPSIAEVCDSNDIDENCNGLSDNLDSTVLQSTQLLNYFDNDADGYGGNLGMEFYSCDLSPGYSLNNFDCDDLNEFINPLGIEVCDENDLDENCNGFSDDDDLTLSALDKIVWSPDGDGDGFGDENGVFIYSCEDPSTLVTYVPNTLDCDDNNSLVSPSAIEVCDDFDIDEDCNGYSDDTEPNISPSNQLEWYPDFDLDGFGSNIAIIQCERPLLNNYININGDCNDNDLAINPNADEVCDNGMTDEDCDGLYDDDDPDVLSTSQSTWFEDFDEDGFGNELFPGVDYCVDPSMPNDLYSDNSLDCDDTDNEVHPNGSEWYGNNIDEDCDGVDYFQQTNCVGSQIPLDYSTLEDAVNSLGNGSSVERICLSPGTYSGDIQITGNLQIIGTSREEVIIDGRLHLKSGVEDSITTLSHLTVTNGVYLSDDGSVDNREYILTDSRFETSETEIAVEILKDTGRSVSVVIERCELEGKPWETAALSISDDSQNTNGVLEIVIRDSWLRDSWMGIYISHEGNYYNYPQLYLEAFNNAFTGNGYGNHFTTTYSSSEFVIYNNLYLDNYAGWYWGDYSSIGTVAWNENLFNGNSYLYSGSYYHDNDIYYDNPLLDSAFNEPVPTINSPHIGLGESYYMETLDYFYNPRSNFPMLGPIEIKP